MDLWDDLIQHSLDHETLVNEQEQLEWIAREPSNAHPFYNLAQLRRKITIIAQRMRTPDPATTTVAAGEALALFAGELETVLAEENTFPMKRYP